MKGFYIYEAETHKEAVDCLELANIVQSHSLTFSPGTIMEEVKMHALVTKETKTKCSKDDTYDFETGALIALMKMCGVDKVVRAFNEVFPKERYNTYVAKLEGKLHELKKDFDKLGDRNKYLIEDINKKLEYIKEKDEENKRLEASNCAKGILNGKLLKDYNTAQNAYEVMVEKSADLMDKVKKLEEENEKLKSDKDKSWKNYQRKIQKKQDRINQLERAYKASNDDEAKLVEYYQREIKKLEAENEKLKLDCEKLQHGYNDIDNVPSGHWDGDILDIVFLPGRACGKQYTALVDLFKKIDQKKVDAAYKEAYDTTLPVWQKEFFKQMYDITVYRKTELPRTLDINGTVYRKSIQIKDFGEQINKLTVDSLIEQSRAFTKKCVDEWLYKIPTKREEMWENILKEGRTPVYVKRGDVHDFLKECQVMGIKWATGKMPLETMPFHMSEGYDGIYFFVMTSLDLSKSTSGPKEFRHVMCWWMTASDEEARNSIKYLPPMRWDLFKKGRLAVKVDYDNYKEFYEACEKELGKRPVTAFFTEDFTVSICKKDGNFEIFTIEHQKETGRKIVDWEDVR